MRTALALMVGAVLAIVTGLVLGEYPFVGFTPYLAAVAVPAIVAAGVVCIGDTGSEWLWVATGVLGAAAIGWAVWISTGRGVDPVPAGAWVAIAIAFLWPVCRAAYMVRTRHLARRRPVAPQS